MKGCTVTPKGRPVLSFCAAFSGTLRDVSLRQRSRPASSEPPVLDMLCALDEHELDLTGCFLPISNTPAPMRA